MNHENIVSEFNRGLKSLQAAQILLKEGLYEDAVSRGYYAVMHAAKAALFYHNTLAESHSAVRRLFGKILVNPGHIEKEWARILSQEQDQRIVADYSIQIPIAKEAADDLIKNAEKFIERIRTYLQECGVELRVEKEK